ncbi:DNA annealing helicase and endonuclease ZRANB3-like [Glandiceps talaboti]
MAAGGELAFLPPVLREKLMPFQREGVKFALRKEGRCLIGDEMGLGKTIQAIAVAYHYVSEWPLLIVVPSSLKYSWVEELERWLPGLQPNDINMIASSTDIGDIPTSKISILGYGLFKNEYRTLHQALADQNFQVVILDESHYIKNLKAARTKLLVPLLQNTKRALLLTGTPALSRPAELFPQIQALKANLFGSWTSYAKRYCNAQWKYYGRQKTWDTGGASHLPELHAKLKDNIMIRREKKQVLSQLPPKRKQKIPFELNETPQKKEVDRLTEELMKVLKGEMILDEGVHPKTIINGLISTLYIKTAEAKAGAVREYIKTLMDNRDQKFLVFAHHHFMMQALTEAILEYNKEHRTNIKHVRIDGKVPVAERPRLVKSFQTDDNVKIAVLSMLAAGTGLTFTAATQVVFAELHWTPGVMDQCEDRAHRIGQLNSIQVHYLVARGTIDDFIWSAITRKVSVVSHALSGQLHHLRVDECDKEDAEFLSHAAAWLPRNKDEEDEDDEFYFSSQGESKQPSILSFFTPKSKTSPKKRKMKTGSPNICQSSQSNCSVSVITIQSDDEDFQNQPIRKKLKKTDASSQPIKMSVGKKSHRKSQSASAIDIDLSRNSNDDSDLPDYLFTPQQDSSSQLSRESQDIAEKDDIAANEKSWSCIACTFENHEELPFCEICDTPRKQEIVRKLRSSKIQKHSTRQNLESILKGKGRKCDVSAESDDASTKDDDVTEGTHLPQSRAGNSVYDTSQSDNVNTENDDVTTESDDTSTKDDDVTGGTGNSVYDASQSDNVNTENDDVNTENDDIQSFCSDSDDTIILDYSYTESDDVISSKTPKATGGVRTPRNEKFTDTHTLPENRQSSSKLRNSGKLSRKISMNTSSPNLTSSTPLRSKGGVLKHANVEVSEKGAEDSGDKSSVNQDVPAFDKFHFCASKYTDRIYIYDEDNTPLNVSFSPVDIQHQDLDDLPELLHYPDNMKLVRRFVREWNSVNEMKRRQVRKSGQIFFSLHEVLNDVKKKSVVVTTSKKRYLSKADLAKSALEKAEAIGGSVRVISKHGVTPGKQKRYQPDNGKRGGKTSTTPRKRRKALGKGNEIDSQEMQEILKLADVDDVWSDEEMISGSSEFSNTPSTSQHHAIKKSSPWNATWKSRKTMGESRESSGKRTSVQNLSDRQTNRSMSLNFDIKEDWSPRSQKPSFEKNSQFSRSTRKEISSRRSRGITNIDNCAKFDEHQSGKTKDGKKRSSEKSTEKLGQNETFSDKSIVIEEPDEYRWIDLEDEEEMDGIHGYSDDVVELGGTRKHTSDSILRKRDAEDDQERDGIRRNSVHSYFKDAAKPVKVNKEASEMMFFGVKKREGKSKHKEKNAQSQYNEEVLWEKKTKEKEERETTLRTNSTDLIGWHGNNANDDVIDGDEARVKRPNRVQVVDSEGRPLCLFCNKPCRMDQSEPSTSNKNIEWDSRYCSEKCKEDHYVRAQGGYVREQLSSIEHGLCQICGLDAHSLYVHVKSLPKKDRKDYLATTSFSKLPLKLLNNIIDKPSEGKFWQADHIVPVADGGGLCSLDNFRTLCTGCHRSVTNVQSKQRQKNRKIQARRSAGFADITTFFKPS